jgi:hypothetical protein
MSGLEVVRISGDIRREDFLPLEEDAEGAWMSNERKVAAFLPWFTNDPIAEAPLKHIITVSHCKNHLRLVSKLFKSHAEEGTTTIKWQGRGVTAIVNVQDPEVDQIETEPLSSPNSLWSIISVRDRYGGIRDRLPNLKNIDCNGLDTLMDLNGCPVGLETLSCNDCTLIQSLDPLAACTNLRKLTLLSTRVSGLKPLMGCAKLEYLALEATLISDLSPLSACINLKALWIAATTISDLRPLSGLCQLKLVDVETTKVSDLSPLSSLPHLETLICGSTEVSDLNPLLKCPELKALDISDTEVKSLTPLLHCKKLKYLNHGDFQVDQAGEEQITQASTAGYIRLFQELKPGLICTRIESVGWMWANEDFPAELQHDWDRY